MPSNDPGAPHGPESPGAKPPAAKLDPASTQFFEEGEDGMNLVAAVGLEGRVVKFFEPEEGTLLEVEMAVEGVANPDPAELGLSGSALYAFLTKSEAPAALLDAERRVNDLAARNGIDLLKERKAITDVGDDFDSEAAGIEKPARELPGVRPTAEWCEGSDFYPDSGYFQEKYCTPTNRFWHCGGVPWEGCIASTKFQKSGVNMMQSGAWSFDGQHHYYVKYGIEYRHITLNPGYLWGWRRTSGTNRNPYSEVIIGDGPEASYRHCVNYRY